MAGLTLQSTANKLTILVADTALQGGKMKARVMDANSAVRLLPVFCIIAAFLSPWLAAQAVLNHSDALTALIQQADRTYARAAHTSIQHYFNNIPVNAAICMGLAMHGQKRIADPNPQYLKHYEALRREAHEFLEGLAKAHNFRNPLDGQPMDRQSLAAIFDSNASGEQNQWAVQNRLPDPAAVRQPFILDRVTPQSLAKLHLKDDSDSIRLLDQTAPPVIQEDPRHRQNPAPPPGCPASYVVGTWWLQKSFTKTIHRYEITQTGDCTFVMRSPETADHLEFRYSGEWSRGFQHDSGIWIPSAPRFILTRIRSQSGWVQKNEAIHIYRKPEGDEMLILLIDFKLFRNKPR
jgi:hypothetical protein